VDAPRRRPAGLAAALEREAHHELLFAVQPIQALVIHRVAFRGRASNPSADSRIGAAPRPARASAGAAPRRPAASLIAQRRAIPSYQSVGVPLTQPVTACLPSRQTLTNYWDTCRGKTTLALLIDGVHFGQHVARAAPWYCAGPRPA